MNRVRTFAVSSLCGLALAGCGAPEPSSSSEPSAAQDTAAAKDPLILINLNYACNPGFETANSNVPMYSGIIGHGFANQSWFAGWDSAAYCWPATSNDLEYGTVTTWLTNEHYGSSTTGHGMLVAAGTNNGGVGQMYWSSTTSTPPLGQRLTVHVKVLSGQVAAAIGHAYDYPGGFKFNYAYSQVNPNTAGPQWETLTVCAPTGVDANQVFFYALGAPAVFYVDDVNVFNWGDCP